MTERMLRGRRGAAKWRAGARLAAAAAAELDIAAPAARRRALGEALVCRAGAAAGGLRGAAHLCRLPLHLHHHAVEVAAAALPLAPPLDGVDQLARL